MNDSIGTKCGRAPWNKGKLIGQKLPLKQREIWRIRANLEHEQNVRELAMFDLAIVEVDDALTLAEQTEA